jgi:predicted DNA-binding WGR domain protein
MKIKLEKIDYNKNQQKFYNVWIHSDDDMHELVTEYGRLYTMGKRVIKFTSPNYFECKKKLDSIVHQKLSKGYEVI